MTLHDLLTALDGVDHLRFRLPDGRMVAPHAHVTEVAHMRKHFVDCGGTERHEDAVHLQLLVERDVDHRLAPRKLQRIIRRTLDVLSVSADAPVRVEHQGRTVEVFDLGQDGDDLVLHPRFTDCLARETCGLPPSPLTSSTSTSCC